MVRNGPACFTYSQEIYFASYLLLQSIQSNPLPPVK